MTWNNDNIYFAATFKSLQCVRGWWWVQFLLVHCHGSECPKYSINAFHIGWEDSLSVWMQQLLHDCLKPTMVRKKALSVRYHPPLATDDETIQEGRKDTWSRINLHPTPSFSCCAVAVISDSLRPHELQHARLPSPLPSPGACSNSCPLSQWCHPTISSSVIPSPLAFSLSQHQGLLWIGSSHQVAQSIGISASTSVLPMNIQGWFHLGLTGFISLLSKEL